MRWGGGRGVGGYQAVFLKQHIYITSDFPGGGSGPPVPPSGSAHVYESKLPDRVSQRLLGWSLLNERIHFGCI